jgi:hypothetical protein
MPLKNVKNNPELFVADEAGVSRLCDLTNAILWAGLCLDLDKITAENVDEWVFRAALMKSINRAVISRGREKSAFTRTEIVRHIGLTTCARSRTRKQFLSNLMQCLERDVERSVLGEVRSSATP